MLCYFGGNPFAGLTLLWFDTNFYWNGLNMDLLLVLGKIDGLVVLDFGFKSIAAPDYGFDVLGIV